MHAWLLYIIALENLTMRLLAYYSYTLFNCKECLVIFSVNADGNGLAAMLGWNGMTSKGNG